jgi:hypothetical protein
MKFKVRCFKSIEDTSLFVLIDMKELGYQEQAEECMFPVKLRELSAKIHFKKSYMNDKEDEIEKFTTKDKQ